MVVGEVAVHICNVLARHFLDDQSAVIGDEEAAITAFSFAWGASSKGHLETKNRLEAPLSILYKDTGRTAKQPLLKEDETLQQTTEKAQWERCLPPRLMAGTKSLRLMWWKKRTSSRKVS